MKTSVTLPEILRSYGGLLIGAALLIGNSTAFATNCPSSQSAEKTTQASVSAPRVFKVEPPDWWVGYYSPLMVLLYGENLESAKISVNYPGASISKIQLEPDGKHAFVWMNLGPTVKPGDLTLRIETASGRTAAAIVLHPRSSPAGKFQGITPNDVIYLILTDRFADGSETNNEPAGAAAKTYDRSNPRAYHGGDLKGIRDHLPYLKQLGVTALWLTPLYENDNSSSDYHGYHAVDEYAVEDRFGTMGDLQALVDGAHRIGMKVLLDMVPNHVGPKHPWAMSQPDPGWLHGTVTHHLNNSDYNFAPVSDPHAVPANYIHALNGWFADVLPDLAQENPLVASYLLQNALWWTESTGVDAFRIDTFPYVPRSFWSYYDKGIFAAYPHFFTMGEVSNEDPSIISYWAGGQTGFDGVDTGLSTTLDFPMYGAIRDVVGHGASAKKLVDVLRQDRLYPHPELLVTFIDNHDKPRFLTDAGGSIEKLKLAFSLLATTRGIPQLYYGDEVAMAGGDDPDDRRDFPGGFPGDSHNAFTREGRTAIEQDVYFHVQKLLQLRREHSALRIGMQKHVAVADNYYVFTREQSAERLLMVFFDDTAAGDITLDLAGTSVADAKALLPILGDCKAELNGGKLHLHPSPMSLTVFKLQ
jgi:neopullulanase